MILIYSHTPVPARVRRNPKDLRKKCLGAVHSYRDENGHEYRYEFLVNRGETLPTPPITIDHDVSIHDQVSGLLRIWG